MATTPVPADRGGPEAASRGARAAWTAVGLVLALAAVGIWVGREVQTEFRNSYATVAAHERTYPGPIHRVVVEVATGTVDIERGPGHTTVVDTTGTRASRSPTDDEHLVGSTLYLRSSCGRTDTQYCSRNYRVEVPASVSLDATVETGNLIVARLHGGVRASVGSGNVWVTKVIGSVDVASQSGSVVVRQAEGPVTVSAGTGGVVLSRTRGPLDVRSAYGGVSISGATSSVRVSSGTGNVVATGLTGGTVSATVTSGSIELGFTADPHDVEATTQTGNVSVHVPYDNTRYRVDAKRGTGGIVASEIPNDPKSTRVLRAITANGSVVVGVGAVVATPSELPTMPTSPTTPTSPTRPTTKPAIPGG